MDINEIIGDAPARRDDGFVIETEKHALWATGKIRDAEESLQDLKARYEDYKRQLDEWYQTQSKALEQTVESMSHFLRPYVAEQIASGKKKSLLLPDGTKAGYRSSPARINDTDPDATIEWCEYNAPEAVKVEKRVLKSVLKDRLKQGKALPPTVDIEPGDERFYVDVTGD